MAMILHIRALDPLDCPTNNDVDTFVIKVKGLA